jgi:hypothetical protein
MVAGGIIMVVILLVLPVIIIMSMTLIAGVLGWLTQSDVDDEYVDTEWSTLA